jgi:phenylacetate-CoA ligase
MWRTVLGKKLKPAELIQMQNRKLRALVKHSYMNVPYYRNLFQKVNLDPDEIKTIDDLRKIPITRKKDIIDLPVEEITASNITVDHCVVWRTSGTTGIPLTVRNEYKTRLINKLMNARWHLECGDRVNYRHMDLGGDLAFNPGNLFRKIGLYPTKWISPYIDVKKQIEEIITYDPRTLLSMPSILEEVTREIIEENIKGLDIRHVFSGNEYLDEPTRRLIQETFNVDVFQKYGSSENSIIASECNQHIGLHTITDLNIVEMTRDGELVSTGDEGEVTVTNLLNYAMPFIRYDLEDIGLLLGDTCPCGNCSPLVKITEGRKKDRIKLPDGKVIPALAVIVVIKDIHGIKQFQLTQEKADSFIVRIVKNREFTDAVPEEIKQKLRQKLGDVEIDVVEVESIPRGRSRKLIQFISNIPSTVRE